MPSAHGLRAHRWAQALFRKQSVHASAISLRYPGIRFALKVYTNNSNVEKLGFEFDTTRQLVAQQNMKVWTAQQRACPFLQATEVSHSFRSKAVTSQQSAAEDFTRKHDGEHCKPSASP